MDKAISSQLCTCIGVERASCFKISSRLPFVPLEVSWAFNVCVQLVLRFQGFFQAPNTSIGIRPEFRNYLIFWLAFSFLSPLLSEPHLSKGDQALLEKVRANIRIICVLPGFLRLKDLICNRSAYEILKTLYGTDVSKLIHARVLWRLHQLLINELSIEILVVQVPMGVKCMDRENEHGQ